MVDVKILAPGCAQDPIDAQKIGTGRKSGVTRQIGDGYNEEPVIPQVMNWKTKPIDPQIHRRSLKDKMGVISKRRKRNLRNGADPSA
jgi:hypothetical protein